MEPADHYLTLLTRARASTSDLDALRAALDRADPDSHDRAAFALLNLSLLKDKAPDDHAWFHRALTEDLKATMFSQVRLRTSIAATAAIGSCWAPTLPLRDASPKMIEDAIRANIQAPLYQMFLRAVDHSWDEMIRAASSIAQFGGRLAYHLHVTRHSPTHAHLAITGRDAPAFGVYIMPGFLRGVAPALRIALQVEVIDEDADLVLLDMRW